MSSRKRLIFLFFALQKNRSSKCFLKSTSDLACLNALLVFVREKIEASNAYGAIINSQMFVCVGFPLHFKPDT